MLFWQLLNKPSHHTKLCVINTILSASSKILTNINHIWKTCNFISMQYRLQSRKETTQSSFLRNSIAFIVNSKAESPYIQELGLCGRVGWGNDMIQEVRGSSLHQNNPLQKKANSYSGRTARLHCWVCARPNSGKFAKVIGSPG